MTARFRDFLHRVVLAGLREGVDDIQINAAVQLQQGWMHIHGASSANFSFSFLFFFRTRHVD
jgi:hypothetical protein